MSERLSQRPAIEPCRFMSCRQLVERVQKGRRTDTSGLRGRGWRGGGGRVGKEGGGNVEEGNSAPAMQRSAQTISTERQVVWNEAAPQRRYWGMRLVPVHDAQMCIYAGLPA